MISSASNAVTATISVGTYPYGVAVSPDGAYVYVTNILGNSVSVMTRASNTVTATISVRTNPCGFVVSPNSEYVYVTNNADNTVSVIDTAIDTFEISVTHGTHGTISPETTTVIYGGNQEFTITPATGYHIVYNQG